MAMGLLVLSTVPASAREGGNGRVQAAQADGADVVEPAREAAPEAAPPEAPEPGEAPSAPAEPQEAAAPPAVNPLDSACGWLGRRAVTVLLRDDLIAAEGFLDVYRRFDCPMPHLGLAFGCSVPAAGLESAEAMEDRVAACWIDPMGVAAEKPPPSAPAQPPAEAMPEPAEDS